MNATSPQELQTLALVDIIDFKWMMAGAGHHVHVERLQNDPAYAAEVLSLAERSGDRSLHEAAGRLRAALRAAGR